MATDYAYPSIKWDALTSFPHLRYHRLARTLIYETLYQRFLGNVVPITRQLRPELSEYLDPCYGWKGNNARLLSHKYLGMVTVTRLCFALTLPADYDRLFRHSHKRMRLTSHHRCGNEHCVRPDHLIPHQSLTYFTFQHKKPIKRSKRKTREDVLNYIEAEYLYALIRMRMSRPEVIITNYAEHLNLPFNTVADVWRVFVTQIESINGYPQSQSQIGAM